MAGFGKKRNRGAKKPIDTGRSDLISIETESNQPEVQRVFHQVSNGLLHTMRMQQPRCPKCGTRMQAFKETKESDPIYKCTYLCDQLVVLPAEG